FQLILSDEHGRGPALLRPALDDRRQRDQAGERRVLQHDQQINVRVIRLVLARSCGSVQDDARQVRSGSLLELVDKLADLFLGDWIFTSHSIPQFLLLPTASGAATTRAAATKSTETTATAKTAAAPITPTSIASPTTTAEQEHVEQQTAQRRNGQHNDDHDNNGNDRSWREFGLARS